MSRRGIPARPLFALLTPLAVAILSGAAAPVAPANVRVSLTLPASADAGAPVPFSYTARGMRARDRLVVQRQQGTARAWRTVRTLSRSKRSSELSGLPLGSYKLRIAVLDARSKVQTQQARTLKVFGKVPFSTLFTPPGEIGGAWYSGAPQSGVYTTPTSTFAYAMRMFANLNRTFTFATVGNNKCRSAHFDFVPGGGGVGFSSPSYGAATLSVVQEALEPTAASAGFNQLGALDVTLEPGSSWSLNSLGSGESVQLYTNGYAVCFSDEPFLKP